MQKIVIFLVFSFLAKSSFSQVLNDTNYIPCNYYPYFKGICYDSIHIIKLKALGGTIFCEVCNENIKPDKEKDIDKQCNKLIFTKDSLEIVLNHNKLIKTRIYRVIVFTDCRDIQPKNFRIDCGKPPD